MTCSIFHLINSELGCFAIYQGLEFNQTIFVPNTDLTGKTIIGEIRSASLDDEGELIATFEFTTPIYNASIVIPGYNNGVAVAASRFTMSLPASVTKTIKAPVENLPKVTSKTIEKIADVGSNVWVYDVRAIDLADPKIGIGIFEKSFVQVIERSTQ